jgi:hypothetical protein
VLPVVQRTFLNVAVHLIFPEGLRDKPRSSLAQGGGNIIEWVQQTLNRLRDTHRDLDCEVIHCHDGDILFVSRHLQVDALYAIADDFIRANCAMQGDAGHIALYDMCRDWRIMKDLLLNKTPLYVAEPTLPNPVYDFGEVGSLRDVFAEAKKLRVARAPVHVMIVEDDARKGDFSAAGGSFWFKFSDWIDFGVSRWSFYHKEIRHNSVRFYSDYLPAGNYHLSYAAQAIATGSFSALPAIAQEMYDPDVYGKTDALTLKVNEAQPPAPAKP